VHLSGRNMDDYILGIYGLREELLIKPKICQDAISPYQ